MKILITGATGLLGPYITVAARAFGDVTTTSLSAGEQSCDLTDPNATARLIKMANPSIVIHTAGWTDVDGCDGC